MVRCKGPILVRCKGPILVRHKGPIRRSRRARGGCCWACWEGPTQKRQAGILLSRGMSLTGGMSLTASPGRDPLPGPAAGASRIRCRGGWGGWGGSDTPGAVWVWDGVAVGGRGRHGGDRGGLRGAVLAGDVRTRNGLGGNAHLRRGPRAAALPGRARAAPALPALDGDGPVPLPGRRARRGARSSRAASGVRARVRRREAAGGGGLAGSVCQGGAGAGGAGGRRRPPGARPRGCAASRPRPARPARRRGCSSAAGRGA